MASLQTPLLAALVLLAMILQATEAGEVGKREASLWTSRSDTGVSSSCDEKSTELRRPQSAAGSCTSSVASVGFILLLLCVCVFLYGPDLIHLLDG